MNEEEKYCSNLERVYVHEVYEKISSKYDELLNLSQRSAFERLHVSPGHPAADGRSEPQSLAANKADALREAFKESRRSKSSKNEQLKTSSAFKCNIWPKVKKFLLNIEPYSLIGKHVFFV
jgi:hypothetical protein